MTFRNPLPNHWSKVNANEENYPSWHYEHEFLDVDIHLSAYTTTTDLGIESEHEYAYVIFLEWTQPDGAGIEGNFEPENIIGREAGADWCIALMSNINQMFVPGDEDFVNRAMQATRGEEVEEPTVRSSPTGACPMCDASYMQYRGIEPLQKARNHIEYENDDQHEGITVSVGNGNMLSKPE